MLSLALNNRFTTFRPQTHAVRFLNRLVSRSVTLLLILILSLLVNNTSHAGQFSVLFNGKAIHLNDTSNKNYNEENWGAGVQYEYGKSDNKWIPFTTISGFLDSHKNPSYYAGGGYVRRFMLSEKMQQLHFDAGLIAFLMSREDYRDGDLFPGVLPMMSLGTKHAAINVTYIPEVAPKMVELWFFQLKLTLAEF